MLCPNCIGYQLQAKELEPGMVSASCDKCQGSLLSLINYQFWLGKQPPVTQPLDSAKELSEVEDSAHAKLCPKCNRLMAKYKFSNQSANRLDYCAPCSETWMDKGEWELVKEAGLEQNLAEIFTDKWKRLLREQRTAEVLEGRYRSLLGDEVFDQSVSFKTWLGEQEKQRDILQYLQL